MKSSNQFTSSLFGRAILSALPVATFMTLTVSSTAADLYWDNGAATTAWATFNNWDTAADGTGGNPSAFTTSDIYYFNTSGLNTPQTIATATRSVGGLVFNNTAATTINTAGSDATLTLGAGGLTINSGAGVVTFGGATTPNRMGFTIGAAQSWTNNSANTLSILRGVALGANALTIDGTGTLEFTSAITSTTGGSVIKQGSGTMSLITTETFNGGLTVKAGVVTSSRTTVGTIFGTGTVNLGDTSGSQSATLQSTAANSGISNNIIVVAGSTSNTLTIQGSVASPTFSGTVALNNALTVDSVNNTGNQTTTFSGVITGNSTITKGTGLGTVALTGANGSSYTGNTVINGGALSFTNGALGNGSGSITFGGDSTLRWAAGNTQDISSHQLSSSGFTATLDVGTNNVTLATANGLTGSGNFTKYFATAATGTLTLSAANDVTGTYTGSTSGGATILANANALQNATVAPSNLGTSGIVFDQSVTANGNRFTIGGLTGSGLVALQNNAGTPAAIALQIGNNNVSSTSTAISGITGPGSLEKIGTGTFTLNTPGYYTGDTTVTAGTFALGANGSLASSKINVTTTLSVTAMTGDFVLGGTQTVGGTGTILATGKVVTANGTLSPGNSPGNLTQDGGTLQLGNTGDLNWQVHNANGAAGSGYDTVSLINGATLDLSLLAANTYNINLWSLSGIGPDVNGDATFDNTQNYSWTLFSTAFAITGFDAGFFNINTSANNGANGFTNALGGGTFAVGLSGDSTDLVLNFTAAAVPEPDATALVGGFGLLALLRRRR